MGRYTGPVCRICRGQGEKLFLKGEKCYTPKCTFEKRPFAPGQRSMRRRKVSDRGLQLRAKQKVRVSYGMLERQFLRFYETAVRRPGVTGDNLLRMLELRLDSVVFHLGFADSRAQARQIALHGHITTNGRKDGIPSHVLKPGDVIGWTERGRNSSYFATLKEVIESKNIPSWLSLDTAAMTGRIVSAPDLEEANARFNTATIVEFYSR